MKHKLSDKQLEVMHAANRGKIARDPQTFTWRIDQAHTVTNSVRPLIRAGYLLAGHPAGDGSVLAVVTKAGREAIAQEEARRA